MIDLNSVLAEIEQDLSWRQDELAFFENDLTSTIKESHQKLKTRPLILLLYAHFEGHAKLMLLKYANEINKLDLDCSRSIPNLVASTLDPIFGALKNPDKSHPLFKKEYDPDFKELCRRIEFLEVLNQIMTTKISLNVDKIVDVESNLKPPVLKKIFYRLGIQHDCISDSDLGNLAKLLGYRNNIAHGGKKDGMLIAEYYNIKTSISDLLYLIKAQIISHLSQKKYELAVTS
ncbi:MAE_28990/MAE_18760 family HEPN-like nuclease [Acinetobacter bereziniae]|uniref:MAE_28990/MAE_18760 family HEPN-like nuclease n=1 Tax=Acinetobacter bereziniae TaxID=106648 RepID=UPI001902B895|nr:MAE_28990/MAE_18760 family HEPN-like nuclease [Acinetobacter bereziniae]MBJ9902070.1 hypothetical protein [Acinetobacter bereziniae]MCU4321895.1 hypothetical protein [Acinetobacter bereziniae]MCU4416235.1 hypothetical protein [Acinetobacter bereziniae]MCU4600877.1 hypothetical protein [Acinetobacter bereziniae]